MLGGARASSKVKTPVWRADVLDESCGTLCWLTAQNVEGNTFLEYVVRLNSGAVVCCLLLTPVGSV